MVVFRGGVVVVAIWISVRKTPENGIVVFPLSLDASEFSFLDACVLVVGHGGQVSPPPPSRFFQVVWPSVCLLVVVDVWMPNQYSLLLLGLLLLLLLDQVVNIPNSMTVLTDLLPVSLAMADKKLEVSNVRK